MCPGAGERRLGILVWRPDRLAAKTRSDEPQRRRDSDRAGVSIAVWAVRLELHRLSPPSPPRLMRLGVERRCGWSHMRQPYYSACRQHGPHRGAGKTEDCKGLPRTVWCVWARLPSPSHSFLRHPPLNSFLRHLIPTSFFHRPTTDFSGLCFCWLRLCSECES